MGLWLKANGRLEIVPPADDKLLIDFWHFSATTWPDDYRRIDEYFKNTWFFDEDIIGEGDPEFIPLDRESSREYYMWLRRISSLSDEAAVSIENFYGDLEERWLELEEWYEIKPDLLPPPNLI